MTIRPATIQDANISTTPTPERRSDHVVRFRPKEMHRLRQDRYGWKEITPDDDGRVLAEAMLDTLALGHDPQQRMSNFLTLYCPWMDSAEREAAIEQAIFARKFWSPSALGEALKLTAHERTKLKITTFRAAGMTDEDMIAKRKAAERERSRETRRQKSLHPSKSVPLKERRVDAVTNLLRPGERCTIKALCAEIRRTKQIAFAGVSGKVLSSAVHDVIEAAVARNLIRKEIEPGPNKWPVAWVSRP